MVLPKCICVGVLTSSLIVPGHLQFFMVPPKCIYVGVLTSPQDYNISYWNNRHTFIGISIIASFLPSLCYQFIVSLTYLVNIWGTWCSLKQNIIWYLIVCICCVYFRSLVLWNTYHRISYDITLYVSVVFISGAWCCGTYITEYHSPRSHW